MWALLAGLNRHGRPDFVTFTGRWRGRLRQRVTVTVQRLKQMDRPALLAWLLALVIVAVASVQLVGWWAAQSERPSLFWLVEGLGWGWALPIVFALTAAAILARQPRHRIGWLLMLPALFIAAAGPLFASPIIPAVEPDLPFYLLAWLSTWAWIPIIFPVILIPLHFPSGQPPSSRWRRVNGLAVALVAWFVLAATFGRTFRFEQGGVANQVPNPLGIIPDETVDLMFSAPWALALVTLVGLSVASLFVRYRRAGRVERQQIKWLLFACLVFLVVYTYAAASSGWGTSGWYNLLFVLSVLGIPLSIGVAILRYQLFDIDVIIRKTAVYALLTGILALIYFGSVVLFQLVFEAVTRQRSPLVIVLSTLLIAAIFTPLRRRVQTTIDRRFYRQRYDARRVLERFAATARDEVALEVLTNAIADAVEETLQPIELTLWLRDLPSGGVDGARLARSKIGPQARTGASPPSSGSQDSDSA